MRTIVGVMGGGSASEETLAVAEALGRLIAENDWVLLNGGRNSGVMAASARGASEAGGLVIGILPGESTDGASPHLDLAIPTGLSDARNAVNVLASRVVIALPGGAGTLSEIALALKSARPVVTVGFPLGVSFAAYHECGLLHETDTPEDAVELARWLIEKEYA